MDAADVTWTKASKQEIAAAKFLLMQGQWQHGYPMPDGDGGYKQLTYDLTDYCSTCGTGAVQRAPFRMAREPKWGVRGIVQLNWIFDEFFVRPEVWEMVFEPNGIAAGPVLSHKTGKELETVVQLLPPIADAALRLSDLPSTTCDVCGKRRYATWTRGCFPAFVAPPSGNMVRSREYFGTGARSYRNVIISGELRESLDRLRIRGADFLPLCA
jgi:hypothetical protein